MGHPISSHNNINIFGVKVDNISVDVLNHSIKHFIGEDSKSTILHVNVHGLNLAYEERWLKDFYNSAQIVFCDGAGVIIGARFLGYKIEERITYADWMWQLAKFAEREDLSLFLLGAKPGIADQAADRLLKRYRKLKILGTHHGYFDMQDGSNGNEIVLQKINELNPNILIVGFGMPIQEKWLLQNRMRINANVALTGGAVFDYVSGDLLRAPRVMTDHGFEWLGRFLIEPKRLWRRYLIGNPLFFYRIIKQRALMGNSN